MCRKSGGWRVVVAIVLLMDRCRRNSKCCPPCKAPASPKKEQDYRVLFCAHNEGHATPFSLDVLRGSNSGADESKWKQAVFFGGWGVWVWDQGGENVTRTSPSFLVYSERIFFSCHVLSYLSIRNGRAAASCHFDSLPVLFSTFWRGGGGTVFIYFLWDWFPLLPPPPSLPRPFRCGDSHVDQSKRGRRRTRDIFWGGLLWRKRREMGYYLSCSYILDWHEFSKHAKKFFGAVSSSVYIFR